MVQVVYIFEASFLPGLTHRTEAHLSRVPHMQIPILFVNPNPQFSPSVPLAIETDTGPRLMPCVVWV